MSGPRTEAGRALMELSAKWRYYPPTTLKAADLEVRVAAIEAEAVAAERARVAALMDRGTATVDRFCLPLDVAREIVGGGS